MAPRLALAASVLLATAGCSSISDLAGGTEGGPHVYGGVNHLQAPCWGVGYLRGGCADMAKFPVLLVYVLIEAPLAAALDTLLLPITIPVSLFRE